MSTSASVSTSSGSIDYQNDGGAFGKMVESGQIGFRLAEEIKSLREELLSLKQEKRILLVSNENLEDTLINANNTISTLHAKLVELQNHVNFTASELTSKNNQIKRDEEDLRQLKTQLAAEKKKNRLLGVELERSLEDEVALRTYSRRLEQDLTAQKEQLSAALEDSKVENEERLRCEQFIDLSLQSQLIFQKKLETVVYYCDKDVDISSVAIFDVSPDYLESLLRDVRSERVHMSQDRGSSSVRRGKLDFSVLQQKQRHIDHQLNQHLKEIRSHLSKHRKVQAKSRKHVRSLLEVIRTYEELPSAADLQNVDPKLQYSEKYTHGALDGRHSFDDQRDFRYSDSSLVHHKGRERNRDREESSHSRYRSGSNSSADGHRENRNESLGQTRQQSSASAVHAVRGEHREQRTCHSSSSPPQRHHHLRENSPVVHRAQQQQQQPGRSESPRRSSRTLALLEQLQREMEKELHA